MSNLQIKARELAHYLIENGSPINCTDRYNYFGSDSRALNSRPIRKNCYGMTFRIDMTEYPQVQEVQLTSLVSFFRTDLEVYIELKCGKKTYIEVLNFGDSFVKKWKQLLDENKLKEKEKNDTLWNDSIDKILQKGT